MDVSFNFKKFLVSLFLGFVFVCSIAAKKDNEPSWMDVFDQTKDKIVQVIVYGSNYVPIKPFINQDLHESRGSGFIATEQGDIYTNWHVIDSGVRIFIQHPLVWRERFEVEFVGGTPNNDWAHLRLKPEELARLNKLLPDGKLQALPLGNSDTIRVGSEIMLLGYPLGEEELKYVAGPVSGHLTTNELRGECFTATNLSMPGNSGGPCVSKNGEVVGISVAHGFANCGGSGSISYIIPINRLKVVQDMLESGKILQEAFWGVATASATSALYRYLHCPETIGGVHVSAVFPNALGQKAGLEKDDILLSINGCPVDRFGYCLVPWTEYRVQFTDVLARVAYGDTVEFVVCRNGQQLTCRVVKEEYISSAYKYYRVPFEKEPLYDVFGGFVIMEMTKNHMDIIFATLARSLKHDPEGVKDFISATGMIEYLSNKKITKPALIITHIFPESELAQELGSDLEQNPFVLIKKVNNIPVSTIEEFRQAALESVKTGLFIIEKYNGSYYAQSLDVIAQQEPMLIQKYRYPISPICQTMLDLQANMEKEKASEQIK